MRRPLQEEELLALVEEQRARINDAYWCFTRQARAKPPGMVVPDAYKKLAFFEVQPSALKRSRR